MKKGILMFSVLVFLVFVLGSVVFGARTIILKTWDKPPANTKWLTVWQEKVAMFEKEHPNIKIVGEYHKMGDVPREEFIMAMMGGTGPDVARIAIVDVPTYAAHGFIADIAKYVKGWKHKDDISKAMWAPVTINGKYYGIPSAGYVMTFFYKKDLFRKAGLPDRAPKDWDELVEFAKKLTHPDKNQYGFGLMGGPWCAWHFLDFVWQAGGRMVKKVNGKWRVDFNDPGGVRALQFYKDLTFKYKVTQPNALANIRPDLQEAFASGQVAMLMEVADQLDVFVNKFGLDLKDLGIGVLPAGPAGRACQVGGSAYTINPMISKEKMDAAWEYLKFLMEPKTLIWEWKRMQELGIPLNPGASPYPNLKMSDYVNVPDYPAIAESMKYARFEPYVPHWNEIKGELVVPIQAAVTDPNADVKKLLDECAKTCNEKYFGE